MDVVLLAEPASRIQIRRFIWKTLLMYKGHSNKYMHIFLKKFLNLQTPFLLIKVATLLGQPGPCRGHIHPVRPLDELQ
jgi:hypothetical protein